VTEVDKIQCVAYQYYVCFKNLPPPAPASGDITHYAQSIFAIAAQSPAPG